MKLAIRRRFTISMGGWRMAESNLCEKRGSGSRLKCLLIGMAAWGLVAGIGSEALADGSTLSNDFRLWSPVFLTVPLSTSFIGYAEVNPRLGEDVSNLNQLILRTAIGYKLNDHWSVWQGYAWNTVYQPEFNDEHRVYQQLSYKETFPLIKIMSRSRLEERWIDHTGGTAFRARTMLRVDVPLPKMIPNTSFVVFDEIFFNLNGISNGSSGQRFGPEAGFDQNRFFVGFNYEFMKQFNVDLGYQMQIINTRRDQLVNQINNTIMINLFINL